MEGTKAFPRRGRCVACLRSERFRSCLPVRRLQGKCTTGVSCCTTRIPSGLAGTDEVKSFLTSAAVQAPRTRRLEGEGGTTPVDVKPCSLRRFDACTTSVARVPSGFADVAEDVLFLTGELANASRNRRDSVLRTSLRDENLRVWHLGRNALGDDGAAVLAATLATSSKLELLGLGHNGITSVGAAAIADAMGHASAPIRVACFASNDFGDRGAAALAAALPFCPGLEVLDLRSNCISHFGAEVLAEALQRPGGAVKKLQLGGNAVGDPGARALAAAWRNCPNLEELALEENGLSDAGAEALSSALRDGATLLLCGNLLTASGKRAVRNAKNAITRSGFCCTVGL